MTHRANLDIHDQNDNSFLCNNLLVVLTNLNIHDCIYGGPWSSGRERGRTDNISTCTGI